MPTPRVFRQKQGAVFFHAYFTLLPGDVLMGDIVFPLGPTRVNFILPEDYLTKFYDEVRCEEDGDMEGRGPDGEPLPTRDPSRTRPRVSGARDSGAAR